MEGHDSRGGMGGHDRSSVFDPLAEPEHVALDTGLVPPGRHDTTNAVAGSGTEERSGTDRSTEPAEVHQAALNMAGNVPILEPPTRATEVLGPSSESLGLAAGSNAGALKRILAPFKNILGTGRKKERPEMLAPAGSAPAAGRGKRVKGQKKVEKTVPIWRLFQYADGFDVLLMVVGSIAAIASGVARPLMTLLLGQLINAFGANLSDPNYLYRQVVKIALDFLYLALGAGVAGYLGMALWTLAGERQATRIRKRYLKAILRQDIGYFDVETSTGEVVGRMTGDTLLIQDAMSEKVEAFVRLMAQAIAGFVIAFTRGWLLALVLMSCLPLLVLSGALMMMRMTKLATEGQAAYAEAGSLVEQVVGAIRTVASFVGERKAVQQYDARIQTAYKTGVKSRASSGLGLGTMIFVLYATYSLALWYGSRLIASHGYNGGEVLNVLMAVLIGGMSLGQTSPSLAAFGSGQAAAWKMFSVIERKPPIDSEDESGMTLPAVKGDIRLSNVHFTYPARPDVQIFKSFDLTIPSGRTVALVGESGSGKSTIISLIERFYDPQEGAVMLDGIDIRKFQVKWLRNQIGLVSQEPALFTATILENVSYGKETATKEEIVAACKAANAHKFISKLPEGYDTQVGERGISLSGGQKQRIAIARAILKNPRVLLLDEATSALDTESERKVQKALDQVMVGRTTVVVAHRLTTVINADKIAVVQRGHIVEEGTHRELLANQEGAYAALVKLQAMAATRKPPKPPALPLTPSGLSERALTRRGSNSASHSFILRSLTVSVSGGSDLGISSRRVGVSDDMEDTTSEPPEKRSRGWRFWRKKGGDVEAGNAASSIPLGRLFRLARPEWAIAAAGVIVTGCNGAIMPIFALLLSRIINVFYNPDLHEMKKKADFWAGMFLMLAILSFVLLYCQYALFGIMGERLIRRVRQMTFKAVLRQDVAWFDDAHNSTGAIGSRLENDAAAVKGVVGDQLALLTQNGITLIIGFVIAFLASWKLTLVVLSVMPLLIVSGYCQVYILKGSSQKSKKMYEGASQVANDATGNIRTVAAFGAEQHVMDLYDAKTAGPQKEGVKRSQINGAALGFNQFVSYAVYSLAFWYGGTLVRDGTTTFQNVFQVFFAIALSAQGVAQGTAMAPDVGKAKAAVQSIFAVLDRKPAVDADDVSGTKVERLDGSIAFREVDFAYPSRPHVQVFSKMTFDVSPGHTVALVGESGSGKSTVISLVERFYDPQGGAVLIDGVDIRKYQLKSLRQSMGLVSQEPNLFAMSIRENITYGKERATDAEIEAAARAANAWNFISALPQGLNTQVGERGVQLSGGQKQRVAIARAMLKDPRILLLDEATSALDAESEHLVQEALDRIMKGRTTIVVAHRLTTIRHADKIMVVKGGRIVEQGTHAELEDKEGGAYRNLVLLSDASTS